MSHYFTVMNNVPMMSGHANKHIGLALSYPDRDK